MSTLTRTEKAALVKLENEYHDLVFEVCNHTVMIHNTKKDLDAFCEQLVQVEAQMEALRAKAAGEKLQ